MKNNNSYLLTKRKEYIIGMIKYDSQKLNLKF